MAESLEQVLADRREQAAVLRAHGHGAQAKSIEDTVDQVADVMRPYLTMLTEKEAALRSGRSEAWLRGRFPEWEASGFATLAARGKRLYRECIVPTRTDRSAARLAGARGESLKHA